MNKFILLMLLLSGCASTAPDNNYQLGDISRNYCTTDNEQLRAVLKVALSNFGVSVGVDYCMAYTVVKVVKSG